MAESQKFIERNRAPRVQISTDIDKKGDPKTELPFIMGVMADLSGKPAEALPELANRGFVEVDNDNFDKVLAKAKPRVSFAVPNTLSGQGNLSVDVSFDRLEDFSPANVAKKVEPLQKLLEARTKLQHLLSNLDGKTKAEDLVAEIIKDKQLMQQLMDASKAQEGAKE
jgi:type VI secretion system protein ImpB